MKKRYHTVNGMLIGETSNGVRRGYLSDALGSVVATVDFNGAVENTYRYKPGGALLAKTGIAEDPKCMFLGFLGVRHYSTRYSDAYARWRHFGYETATWSSRDILWPQEQAYVYAAGNPTTFTDADGLCVSCCCVPKVFWPWRVRQLAGEPSVLDPKDPYLRYGHLVSILFGTTTRDQPGLTTGSDCKLKWFECSNFALKDGGRPGVWEDRTNDLPNAKGFEQWFARKFDCTGNRQTAGFIRDQPSVILQRMREALGGKPVTRHLFIIARLEAGDPCPERLELRFYQKISFDGVKIVLPMEFGTGFPNPMPTKCSQNIPN